MLIRVVAPSFVAGFIYDERLDRCTEAAPILRRHILGKTREQIRRVVEKNGWDASIIRESSGAP